MVVRSELRQGEPGGPIVLSVRHITSKILFHDGIESFGLSVSLRVISGGELGGDLETLTQMLPKFCDELCSSVADDSVGEPMELENVPQKHVSNVHGRGCCFARDQVPHF